MAYHQRGSEFRKRKMEADPHMEATFGTNMASQDLMNIFTVLEQAMK